jgi:hypothetical protein
MLINLLFTLLIALFSPSTEPVTIYGVAFYVSLRRVASWRSLRIFLRDSHKKAVDGEHADRAEDDGHDAAT